VFSQVRVGFAVVPLEGDFIKGPGDIHLGSVLARVGPDPSLLRGPAPR
jgi:hypothetical protein